MTYNLKTTQNDEKMHYKITIFRAISKIYIMNWIVYLARKERWHVIKIQALVMTHERCFTSVNVYVHHKSTTLTWELTGLWHATTTSVIPHDIMWFIRTDNIHKWIAVDTTSWRTDTFFCFCSQWRKWFYWSMIDQNCGILLPKVTRKGIRRRMGG